MKKLFLLIFVIFYSSSSFAQGEANNWFFGNGAGIIFNNGIVTSNNSAQTTINTNEGSATISDGNGNLLFYTDGSTVWNQNHQIMQNGTGLFGDSSSTQSAIIVPQPNTPSIYFIFTVDNNIDGINNGLNYSIVDMSLDGGLGAVTNKNINLLPICSEKITAVLKDCFTGSIWVVTFASQSGSLTNFNSFHAFEVNNTGVSTTSVVSTFNVNINDARGYLKLSPDGTKLANANVNGGLFLYNFDAVTGLVSNQQILAINSQSNKPYGIEFSPNNQFLYVSSSNDYFNQQDPSQNEIPSNHNSTLTQFDVTAANVQASEFTIDQRQLYRGGLQQGPDGKIYRALSSTYQVGLANLGVINNPNQQGAACNYQHNAIDLSPNLSTQGLPPFIQSLFFQTDIIQNGSSSNNLNLCLGDTYTLAGDNIPGAIYTWTMDGNLLPENDFDLFVNQPGLYELTIDPNNGDCIINGQAQVGYFEIPIANQPQDIIICDANNDDTFIFDFTTQNSDVLGIQDANLFTVKYFTSQVDANNDENEIIGNFTNTSNPQTIFVRIDNVGNSNCYDTTSFDVEVFDTPIANPVNNLEFCDNNLDGDETNGQIEFDLGALIPDILGTQSDTDFAVTFHNSQSDADSNSNPLTIPYYNTTPNQETVFARIENISNPDCFDTTSFNLVVNTIPESFDYTLTQCDEDGLTDGYTLFNLTEAIDDITGGNTNVSTLFYTSQHDAENDENEIDPNAFANWNNPQTLYAKVTDDTSGCFSIAELTLTVSSTSIHNAGLFACDDDGTEDGLRAFDLTQAEADILNGFPTPLDISYYETYEDALLETNAITSNYTNIEPYSQVVYVRAENANACFGIGEILLTVHPLPELIVEDNVIYCLNTFPETITINGGVVNDSPNNYYYLWNTGDDASEIQVNQPGTYHVTVSTVYGCAKDRTVVVEASNIATIEDIEVVDAANNNIVTVLVSGEGDYEYALDDINGPYQDENVFDGVSIGFHNVYVRDKNECGISEELVSVIGFPKFFTPNNDGQNDTWQVKGVNEQFQPNTIIYIFNRHGKLLEQIDPLGPGWNGNYNGNPLPGDDYWFKITLQDGRTYTDHFTLKR
jgi:gliding motility-associated-like protein